MGGGLGGLCESWYGKRCVRLMLEGEEGKVKESSQCATEQGTEKQTGAEVRLFHTLFSCEFCGVPLVSLDELLEHTGTPQSDT